MVAIVGNSLKSARKSAKSAFCDVTKLLNAGLPMVRSQTGIREKGMRHLLLPQVVLISLIKSISSNIALTFAGKSFSN